MAILYSCTPTALSQACCEQAADRQPQIAKWLFTPGQNLQARLCLFSAGVLVRVSLVVNNAGDMHGFV